MKKLYRKRDIRYPNNCLILITCNENPDVRDGRTKYSTTRIINNLSEKVQYLLPVLKPLFIQLLYSSLNKKRNTFTLDDSTVLHEWFRSINVITDTFIF